MRPYCAVYVDAGYLLASAATRVTGTSLRGAVTVNHRAFVEALIVQAETASGLPLLRVNWYDSGALRGGNPDAVQEAIGLLPRVKLRLGRLSPNGEQKGVDLRLGLDLVTHARNRVADLVYLVSGDDDLTEAVEEAQGHGVQVILFASPDEAGRPYAVSRHLQREADDVLVIDPATIDDTVLPASRPVPTSQGAAVSAPPAPSPTAPTPSLLAASKRPSPTADVLAARDAARARQEASAIYSSKTGDPAGAGLATPALDDGVLEAIDRVCRSVVTTWGATASEEARRHLLTGRPYILPHLDRALLVDLSAAIGMYDIDDRLRHVLRDRFWEVALPILEGGRTG